ncbi:MAG: FMN-binding protein [Sedimentisphaerales bacterium]|nr:FMN-binding protein [Sedimentisphaerales bacterium]
MHKLKHFIEQSWLLIAASFFFGLLIAVTSAALSPRIEQNKINKRNRLVGALLPEAKNFVPVEEGIEIESIQGKKETFEVFRAMSEANECVGWSFNAIGPGFADKIELVVAVDKDFEKFAGFDVLASNETPGFGNQIKFDYFQDQFKGAPAEDLKLSTSGDNTKIDSEIIAISGATISSEAVVDIINNAMTQIKKQIQQKGLIGDDGQK